MRTAAAHTELTSISGAQAGEEPRVLTFTELKELIEQGKTDQIPNNRVIPNVLSVRSTAPPPYQFTDRTFRRNYQARPWHLCARSPGKRETNICE